MENHWRKDLGQRCAIESQLLRVNRRDCTARITRNTSVYPNGPKFEEVVVGGQVDGPISDLLGTVAEWENSGVRVAIILQVNP